MELDFITKDFAADGVCIENCPVMEGCEFPTSIVIINTTNGSRTILHHPKDLPEINVQQFSKINLDNYSWIHFEVYELFKVYA